MVHRVLLPQLKARLVPWSCILVCLCVLSGVSTSRGAVQEDQKKNTPDAKANSKTDNPKDKKDPQNTDEKKSSSGESDKKPDKQPKPDKVFNKDFKIGKPQSWTAEQLAEVVIFSYGSRPVIDYVGTNGAEEGIIKLATGDDKPPLEGKFVRRFLRKETSDKDMVRIDVELQKQVITFGFNGLTTWAARDGSAFKPGPEAETSFIASLVHDYHALLRYKEDGTTVTRLGNERITGIDTLILELTHKDQSKTRYYISDKTYHILHLEYEVALTPNNPPTKFRESFYDFRAIQGVLRPARTVLYENGKFVQEIELKEMRCRLAKLDEDLFLRYN